MSSVDGNFSSCFFFTASPVGVNFFSFSHFSPFLSSSLYLYILLTASTSLTFCIFPPTLSSCLSLFLWLEKACSCHLERWGQDRAEHWAVSLEATEAHGSLSLEPKNQGSHTPALACHGNRAYFFRLFYLCRSLWPLSSSHTPKDIQQLITGKGLMQRLLKFTEVGLWTYLKSLSLQINFMAFWICIATFLLITNAYFLWTVLERSGIAIIMVSKSHFTAATWLY